MTAGVGRKEGANPADFYPTPPRAASALVDFYLGHFHAPRRVIDPCAGMGCLLVPWVEAEQEGETFQLVGMERELELVQAQTDAHRKRLGLVHRDGLEWMKCPTSAPENGDLSRWPRDPGGGGELDPAADLAGYGGGGAARHGQAPPPDTLVVINPPYSAADEWVHAVVWGSSARGAACAILLRSQWLDDGNTRGRGAYRYEIPPTAILRLPWRIKFNGKGADSCTYSWHIWHPEPDTAWTFWKRLNCADASPMVPTFWAPMTWDAEPHQELVEFWERAAQVSREQ